MQVTVHMMLWYMMIPTVRMSSGIIQMPTWCVMDTMKRQYLLCKNKLRSEIKANTGLSVSVADILVDVDAPRYVYHVGSVGSGYDCTSRINIKINDCGSKPEFAHVAYDVLRVLESANIGVEYVRIYDRMYSVAITTDISPADAAAMLQRVKNYVG